MTEICHKRLIAGTFYGVASLVAVILFGLFNCFVLTDHCSFFESYLIFGSFALIMFFFGFVVGVFFGYHIIKLEKQQRKRKTTLIWGIFISAILLEIATSLFFISINILSFNYCSLPSVKACLMDQYGVTELYLLITSMANFYFVSSMFAFFIFGIPVMVFGIILAFLLARYF